jgi:hypothetical protein
MLLDLKPGVNGPYAPKVTRGGSERIDGYPVATFGGSSILPNPEFEKVTEGCAVIQDLYTSRQLQ